MPQEEPWTQGLEKYALFLLALWTEKGSLDVCEHIASPMVSRSLPHSHLLGQVVNDFLV